MKEDFKPLSIDHKQLFNHLESIGFKQPLTPTITKTGCWIRDKYIIYYQSKPSCYVIGKGEYRKEFKTIEELNRILNENIL